MAYVCKVCRRSFPLQQSLAAHLRVHKKSVPAPPPKHTAEVLRRHRHDEHRNRAGAIMAAYVRTLYE